MSLLDKIDKQIETTEATIKVFEAPSDATMSAYQKGWRAGTLTAWRRSLVALQEIREVVLEQSKAERDNDVRYDQCTECGMFYLANGGYDYCPFCTESLDD